MKDSKGKELLRKSASPKPKSAYELLVMAKAGAFDAVAQAQTQEAEEPPPQPTQPPEGAGGTQPPQMTPEGVGAVRQDPLVQESENNSELIGVMNLLLGQELGAITQYMNHAELTEIWRYGVLSKLQHDHAISEMRHAEALIKRVRFIGGKPQTAPKGIKVADDVLAMIQNDIEAELLAIQTYNQAIFVASRTGDNATKKILMEILCDEEVHLEDLKAQMMQIEQMGLESYLSTVVGSED